MMRQIIYCHRVCNRHLAAKSSFVTRPQSMAYVRRHIIPIINQTKCTISFSYNRRRAASMTLSVPKDWPSSPQIARSHIWNWFEFWQGLAGIPVPGHSQELKASDFCSRTLRMFFSFRFSPRPWGWIIHSHLPHHIRHLPYLRNESECFFFLIGRELMII